MSLSTKEIKEAHEATEYYNTRSFEKYGDEGTLFSITQVNGPNYFFINLTIGIIELPIYSSLDDDRKYNEDKDTYESFKKYLKRRFLEIQKEINSVKI